LQKLLFTETTTLGIRDTEVKRTALTRKLVPVETPLGKDYRLRWQLCAQTVEVNAAPEFEDCKAVAQKAGTAPEAGAWRYRFAELLSRQER
jgi:uncharacterized protein (DUF111 family)